MYGEVDEDAPADDKPRGKCPNWCNRCPFNNVSIFIYEHEGRNLWKVTEKMEIWSTLAS